MKLSMLFILLGILQARADIHAQGSVTLNVQQTEIARVLNRIERKGEFRFLYNYDLPSMKTKVSVNWQNTGIKDALTKLFEGTDLTFKFSCINFSGALITSGQMIYCRKFIAIYRGIFFAREQNRGSDEL